LACWFWRRRFLKNFRRLLLFHYYLPLEKGYFLRLNKLESPPPKDDLCQVWLKLVKWFWRRFLNDSAHFYDYLHFDWLIIYGFTSPLRIFQKRTWLFIWTNLNSLHPKIICLKFDWIWPAGSGEDFKKNFNVFLLFHYYLPLEKGYSLHWIKLESPAPKDDLCKV
jgi:hypothetical protein